MFKYTPIVLALLACRTDKSITVQNPTPKADIISHEDGAEVLEGFETLFVGSVTDSNHNPDELTTIWYSNGEIICDGLIPDLYGQTQCFITLGADENEVTLAVLDGENARGEDKVVVSVVPTEPPTATILTPLADGVYYSDQ